GADCRGRAKQHNRGGVPGRGRLGLAVDECARRLGKMLGNPDLAHGALRQWPTRIQSVTSAISSISTGASSGSTAVPTALSACLPDSTKTTSSSSLAPLTTWGWPVKSGALATKPVTLTIRLMADRLPVTETTAARAFSAQVLARAAASWAPTSAPTLPVASHCPSTTGSWP